LLQQRLGIFLGESKTLPDEKENFRLEHLEKYLVEQELIQHQIDGRDLEEMQPVLKARGILPYGNVGEYEFQKLAPDIEQYVHRLERYVKTKALESIELNKYVADFVIQGTLRNIYNGKMIHQRYAKMNSKDMIRLWIYHLAWCCGDTSDDSLKSVYVSRNAVLIYRYVENSRQILSHLLEMFWEGLHRPLPFFTITGYTYAEQRIKRSKSKREALRLAYPQWVNAYGRGEYDDPYISLCFSESDALDHRFMSICESIFSPMMAHYEVYHS
jgi:exodeoxyribonuclease V gamma subunit